jgi:hypothetical protein
MEHFKNPEIDVQKIRDEILERYTRDQDMRERDITGEDAWDASVDAENTLAMKHIVGAIGWPTVSRVGEEASFAAWLLVQHADHDPVFQQRCVDLMKQANEGDVSKRDIAYLEDRVRVNTGKGQLYGTQFEETENEEGVVVAYGPKPIEDIAHLDERRASVGLEPFEEYRKHLTQKYFPHLLQDK